MPVKRLKVVSVVDALSSALADVIYRMEYLPGQQITESEITTQFGVSRNTVREAIAGLLNCGLFMKEPNRGIFVKKITENDVREIFHFRAMLESEAVRLIIRRGAIPPELIQAVEQIEKDPFVLDDWYHFVSSDVDFHRELVQASGSRRLVRLYETIRMELMLCLCQSKETLLHNNKNMYEHREFIEVLQKGNEEEAVKLVCNHIQYGVENLARGFRQEVQA